MTRRPTTAWEYALSASDGLVLAYLDYADGGADGVVVERRPDVVVLLAAALYERAAEVGVSGAAMEALRPAGCAEVLERHSASVLDAVPADGLGGEQRRRLLDAYGSDEFEAVRSVAGLVAVHAGGATLREIIAARVEPYYEDSESADR